MLFPQVFGDARRASGKMPTPSSPGGERRGIVAPAMHRAPWYKALVEPTVSADRGVGAPELAAAENELEPRGQAMAG
jgi:hypothetical protein